MKATGIVRRIDDLGRVVIPKEIRRTMRIREGDPLEIYTEKDGEVIFKKYSPMGELSDFAGQICDTLYKTTGCSTAITDRDSIISVFGVPRRELHDKSISGELEQVMEDLTLYGRGGTDFRPAFEYIEELRKNGELTNLNGMLYFTDGMGVYPRKKPEYPVAFIYDSEVLDEIPEVPAWAIRYLMDDI